MRMNSNIMMLLDSYKTCHWQQYPPKTEKVYSYFESREGAKFDDTIFFGLQYFLKTYLNGNVVTKEKIDEAEARINVHMNGSVFNRRGWEHILNTHEGKLPIIIKAVPEGTLVPTSNVLMTVENTDDECYWLTNALETLLVQVWYPCTVATQSYNMRKTIQTYLDRTGEDSVDFKLHDFGFRGVTCPEQAGLGGAAHLLNFKGTDNLAGINLIYDYYDGGIAGYSIPASEHSTITSWGLDNELDAFANMLQQYPTGLVACVSDSKNIWNACEHLWGEELHDQIMGRDGVLIVRPDTGDPTTVVLKVLDVLGEKFGYTRNPKGYKVLDPHIRVIQGDGIDYSTLPQILAAMEYAGWSADNVAFGSGGGLLQKLNRDTQRFAFKCSSVTVDGEERDVYKDPVGEDKKASKRGRLQLIKGNSGFWTYTERANEERPAIYYQDSLQTVFKNGQITKSYTLDEVKQNLEESSKELVA